MAKKCDCHAWMTKIWKIVSQRKKVTKSTLRSYSSVLKLTFSNFIHSFIHLFTMQHKRVFKETFFSLFFFFDFADSRKKLEIEDLRIECCSTVFSLTSKNTCQKLKKVLLTTSLNIHLTSSTGILKETNFLKLWILKWVIELTTVEKAELESNESAYF